MYYSKFVPILYFSVTFFYHRDRKSIFSKVYSSSLDLFDNICDLSFKYGINGHLLVYRRKIGVDSAVVAVTHQRADLGK